MSLSQELTEIPVEPVESGAAASDFRGLRSSGQSWRLLQGDASERLTELGDESVDCCMTSPPYFWLRDYGDDNQIGLEASVDEYVTAVTDVMGEVKRCLRPGALLFLNLGDTYYSGKGESKGNDTKSKKRRFGLRAVDKSGGLGIGLQRKSAIGIPWRVALRMMENGWVLRSTIIWHRTKCLPENVSDRPRRSYEYVFMFAKSRKYHFDRDPLIKNDVDEDVWTIAPQKNGRTEIDTAPYPDDLVQRCLSIGCLPGGTVLDPFAGSGTTLKVALDLGFSAIGIELNSEFCSYVVKQLNTLV